MEVGAHQAIAVNIEFSTADSTSEKELEVPEVALVSKEHGSSCCAVVDMVKATWGILSWRSDHVSSSATHSRNCAHRSRVCDDFSRLRTAERTDTDNAPARGSRSFRRRKERYPEEWGRQEAAERVAELDSQGHGVKKHGPRMTRQQLDDRSLHGVDPVTERIEYHGNGKPKAERNATAFSSNEAFAAADHNLRISVEFQRAAQQARDLGSRTFPVEGVALESVLGKNYRAHVWGRTRVGSYRNPDRYTVDTDFTNGTTMAWFKYNGRGGYDLTTMYPVPRSGN